MSTNTRLVKLGHIYTYIPNKMYEMVLYTGVKKVPKKFKKQIGEHVKYAIICIK